MCVLIRTRQTLGHCHALPRLRANSLRPPPPTSAPNSPPPALPRLLPLLPPPLPATLSPLQTFPLTGGGGRLWQVYKTSYQIICYLSWFFAHSLLWPWLLCFSSSFRAPQLRSCMQSATTSRNNNNNHNNKSNNQNQIICNTPRQRKTRCRAA